MLIIITIAARIVARMFCVPGPVLSTSSTYPCGQPYFLILLRDGEPEAQKWWNFLQPFGQGVVFPDCYWPFLPVRSGLLLGGSASLPYTPGGLCLQIGA